MKKMGLVALMALLCLPMVALAVREGVIEDAPMVEARRKTSYLPMHRVVVEETGWMLEEAYTEIDTREMSYDDIRANLTSNCRLTTGERKRMDKLMAAYAAGERTGDGASVLEAKKNVRVGVYALDPAEYDGERVLLLLPGNCLTDEEMLAILMRIASWARSSTRTRWAKETACAATPLWAQARGIMKNAVRG